MPVTAFWSQQWKMSLDITTCPLGAKLLLVEDHWSAQMGKCGGLSKGTWLSQGEVAGMSMIREEVLQPQARLRRTLGIEYRR